ncbi:MAG: LysR family transcriptional regulator [Kofleriaceae bacterium]
MALEDHLDKLPVFLETVRKGSIRSAARALGRSQPGVSRTIRLLEDAVGARLFVRDPEGIKLTPSGQRLFELADQMRTAVDAFRAGESKEKKLRQHVTIGAFESIAVYFFPGFLRYAGDVQAELEISLVTATSSDLMTALRRSRTDLILTVNPRSHRDVVSKVLFRDEYRVYRAPNLTVSKRTPMLAFATAGDARGKTIDKYLESSHHARRRRFVCESFEVASALATAGIGLGILPTRVAQRSVRRGELVEADADTAPWRFGSHPIAVSFLAHRLGDSAIVWLQRALEQYETRTNA